MADHANETAKDQPKDWADRVKEIGGLTAVVAGVLAVTGIAAGALIVGTETAATITGSAAAAIGSMVGAFFGIKVGTDQTSKAIQAHTEEAAKGTAIAAHLPDDKADEALRAGENAAAAASQRGST
jgi:hypothetical protein